MLIACISDPHLGFRGAGREQGGRSIREVDVERAWLTACRQVAKMGADLLTIAGDVFHTVTPSTYAKAAYLDGLRTVTATGAQVVVIGGNHETPRTSGVMSPNQLAAGLPRVHAVHTATVLRLRVGRFGRHLAQPVAVHCYPFEVMTGERTMVPEPEADVDVNIMLIHAAVRSSGRPGALPPLYGGPTAYDVSRAPGFDVIHCGDYHEFRVLSAPSDMPCPVCGPLNGGHHACPSSECPCGTCGHPRHIHAGGRCPAAPAPTSGPLAFYSGSLERTSSNIWQEVERKGWVLVDTDAQTLEFVEVPTRPMHSTSLAELGYGPACAGMVNEVLDVFAKGASMRDLTTDALVRLVVDGFPRQERDLIDWSLVRLISARAVLFNLDLRYRERDGREFGDRRAAPAATLEAMFQAHFADAPEAVRECAAGHMGYGAPTATEVG